LRGKRAIKGREGRRGDKGPKREQSSIDETGGFRGDRGLSIIALRLSPKFSFPRNNDYPDNRKIFSRKTRIVLSLFAKNEAKRLSLSTLFMRAVNYIGLKNAYTF
jgi:hypothetical protein